MSGLNRSNRHVQNNEPKPPRNQGHPVFSANQNSNGNAHEVPRKQRNSNGNGTFKSERPIPVA